MIRTSIVHGTQRHVSSQQRSYHTTRPAAAQLDRLAEDDLEPYIEVLDENIPKASALASMAHSELEQHRELREMARLAAWEMPLLSHLAQPYSPPNKAKLPLKFRYTTYFSEQHPAGRKVVCEFKVTHMAAHAFDKVDSKKRERQILKLKKLCGSRYNPQKDLFKMKCESFETPAQNKRYIVDTINTLIAEAKDLDSGDNFEDVPLDTRHHKWKTTPKFPTEWIVTQHRQETLEQNRKVMLLEEARRVENGEIVSGAAAIEEDRKLRLRMIEDPVMVNARQQLPRGKMGKKEMVQRGRS